MIVWATDGFHVAAVKAPRQDDCDNRGNRKMRPHAARGIVWAAVLVLLVLASNVAVQRRLQQPRSGTRHSATRYSDSDGRHSKNGDSGKGFTGNVSAGGQGFELPNPPSRFDASAAWRQIQHRTADSCWSQQERHLYHTANPSPPSAAFRAAVEEFEAMQRECVGFLKVDSWQWVKDKATWNETAPRYGRERKRCRYIVNYVIPRGLGNRITSYIVSFVLALLTNRAIIVPPRAFLSRRFCNPFSHANTSWTVGPLIDRLLFSTVLPEYPLQMTMTALAKELFTQGDGVLEDMRRRVQEDGTVVLDKYRRWAAVSQDLRCNIVRSPFEIDLPVAHRVLDCAINISHYLPPTYPLAPVDASWRPSSESPSRKMVVFVSSLSMQHFNDMQHHYLHHHAHDSTRVDFWT
ncbi:unnamed protein product [Closterium sp. NIES-54]